MSNGLLGRPTPTFQCLIPAELHLFADHTEAVRASFLGFSVDDVVPAFLFLPDRLAFRMDIYGIAISETGQGDVRSKEFQRKPNDGRKEDIFEMMKKYSQGAASIPLNSIT